MKRAAHDRMLFLIKFLDIALAAGLFDLCWFSYYAKRIAHPFYNRGNWCVGAIYLVLFLIFGKTYDAFSVSLFSPGEMVYSQALSLLTSLGAMFAVICLLYRRFPNPLPALATFSLQLALSGLWSVLANRWYFRTFPSKRTAVIYDVRQGLDALIGEYGMEKKFDIRFTMRVEDCLEELCCLEGMEAVFLSGIHSRERNIILKYCVTNDIDVYVIPRVGDVIMSGAKQIHLFHLPMLRAGRYCPPPLYLFAKRAFDVCVSATALLLLSPVMLAVAAAIKAADGGPVCYRQERLTKDGKRFMIHKFRSMRVDAEQDGVARLSSGDKDSRITPAGRVIRRYRLDETLQLFDILRGSLSIVGPRPEHPEIAERYEREMPEFRLRLQAKAGLTGYAQVYGQYNTTPYDKLQMDLMYIAHPSFIADLKICFATVKILFMPESTKGVAAGSVTAAGDRGLQLADTEVNMQEAKK